MSKHSPGDVERHNVPVPVYTAMLDEDRFAVPDIPRERYSWPENQAAGVPYFDRLLYERWLEGSS